VILKNQLIVGEAMYLILGAKGIRLHIPALHKKPIKKKIQKKIQTKRSSSPS
jgi:hypothetical protein